MKDLPEAARFAIEKAAELLTGAKRRAFQAEITNEFFDGNARRAEQEFGWGRRTVEKGIHEQSSGIECIDNYKARGNIRTEEKWPQLKEDILALVEPESQVDPKFQTPFVYTRVTAKAVREALIEQKGYRAEDLPSENTIGNLLDRLGYRLRPVQKTKPEKKIPETDAIFENVHQRNEEADNDLKTLRISIDTKAKVKLGGYSRGGRGRAAEPLKAWDHDMKPSGQLVPMGILEPVQGNLTLVFGNSAETSDWIVDCLEWWWNDNREAYAAIEEIVINLDCGPQVNSHRTQFMKRITEFADQIERRIHLVYYPPYHSKYNPIERCWGILEQHWNGTLLDSAATVLGWAGTMTWRGVNPVIHFIDRVYEKGVKLTKKAMNALEERFSRSEDLPKWDVVIEPVYR